MYEHSQNSEESNALYQEMAYLNAKDGNSFDNIEEDHRAQGTRMCQENHEWGLKFVEYINAHPEILAHLD